ncbi:MAG: patatin-like phospholipase family protein [Pseudomonadota bacterium]
MVKNAQPKNRTKPKTKVSVDVALQGGGSHGAFTWGVLDRLLEEPWIEVTGVSGTSAGAMNAVGLVQGLAQDGPEQVSALLRTFWDRVSKAAAFSPLQRTMMDRMTMGWRLDSSPVYKWSEVFSTLFSPYDFNPFGFNPLRHIVEETFDFAAINSAAAPRLFQSATNVRSGRLKLFRQPEISADTTLASACLPSVYQAVEIGEDSYWDGGYMGNPPIFPLVRETDATDLILIQINPFWRDEVPKRSGDISNRLNEIIFNSSILHELRAAGIMLSMLEEEQVTVEGLAKGRLHRIHADAVMQELSASSKMNAAPDFIEFLFETGRGTADAWLIDHGAGLGVKTTWLPDIIEDYLSGGEDVSPEAVKASTP